MLVLGTTDFLTNVLAPKQKQEKSLKRPVVKRNEKKIVKLSRVGSHAFCVKLYFVPINDIHFLEGMHRSLALTRVMKNTI